jgi:hypothetical protein
MAQMMGPFSSTTQTPPIALMKDLLLSSLVCPTEICSSLSHSRSRPLTLTRSPGTCDFSFPVYQLDELEVEYHEGVVALGLIKAK